MSNPRHIEGQPPRLSTFKSQDFEAVIAAQEIIYLRRMWEAARGVFGDISIPRPPNPPGDMGPVLPLRRVQKEFDKLVELETLRAKYVRRVHVDPEGVRALAKLCHETGELVEGAQKVAG